uniref:non-specific lipid-transfer protein-like n=1 Tax=Erigeron canadensis TaxID=72917 RepID=UPI001CB9C90C|nr:non-specific lipid-transfer protein-like [Erigeron canadensis]
MGISTRMMVLCIVVAYMVVISPFAEALTCGQVASSVIPCLPYLQKGSPLPPACCAGVKGLNNAANSTPARQTACNCLKKIYNSNAGIDVGKAAGLPGKCGVNVPYKISPSTDCTKIR